MTSIEEDLRSGAVLAGADHKRIWLEPYPGGPEGRTWCEDKVWPEHEGDPEPTEYVRADIHQSEVIGLMKTLAAYTDRALAAEAKCDALREALADAAEAIEHWGAYASSYLQEKHDWAGDIARARQALAHGASNDG